MNPYKQILVPTDFSEGVTPAIDAAVELRRAFGGTITLLHVVESPVPYEGYGFASNLIPDLVNAAERSMGLARTELQRRIDPDGSSSDLVFGLVELGAPAQHIVARAEAGPYDLVVMGTHGRTGVSHLFIGSVAERVVRSARCPVLTVRRAMEA